MMLWAVALALQVRVVTLDEAERLAATHQPKIHEAAADTEAARARVDQAWATLLPQLRIYGSYSRTSANYAATPGSLPSSLKGRDNTFSSDTFNYFSFGIGAAQSLFDLGAIERTLLAKAATQAQMDAQRDTALQVDSLVAMSFFNVQAREALVRVARETLENRRRHRREIEGFVAARARPIIDLAQVRADEASAEVLVLQADNDCRLAKAQLGLAVGVDLGTDFVVAEESMDPVPGG